MGWLGVVISAIAAWLLWDDGWLWRVLAVGVGMIELWSWLVMHNVAREARAMFRPRNLGGFYNFTKHEATMVGDGITTINLVGFVAAVGLFIAGFLI